MRVLKHFLKKKSSFTSISLHFLSHFPCHLLSSFLFHPLSSFSLFSSHTETEITRQVTPSTKNGHPPRSSESERELSICHFLLTELTRQMTLPTENGHAAPPEESRKSCESVNPYNKSEPGEFSRVESNRAASSTPVCCPRGHPPKLGQQ